MDDRVRFPTPASKWVALDPERRSGVAETLIVKGDTGGREAQFVTKRAPWFVLICRQAGIR